MKKLLFCSCLCFITSVSSAQFLDVVSGQIAPYNNPVNLIRDHMTGSGIEVLDVQFSGFNKAVGYFTGGEQSIGLKRGLIMSSGRVSSESGIIGAQETGTDFATSVNVGSAITDPLLAAQASGPLNDVVRFRITFRASSDSIKFRYVFASEEYPEYACTQFNDVFGFFLEGPNYPLPVNIAKVPGTSMPVAINNIHPANPQENNCPPFFEQFYHDNNASTSQPVYDGFLDVFTATAAVQPCETYVMTLVLADVGDSAYDSAVFLEANSLEGDLDISASFDPGEAILPEMADQDTILLKFSQIPAGLLPLTVEVGGSAINGVDYELIDSLIEVNNSDTVLTFIIKPLNDTLTEMVETIDFTVRDAGCLYHNFSVYLADPDSTFTPLDSLIFNGDQWLTAPGTVLGNMTWSGSNNTPTPIILSQSMVYSSINVEGFGLPELTTLIDSALIASVCVNIDHGFDGDLSFYLIAPNGQFIELSSRNGGSGDNYTNTCFSPSATQSITFGQPFAPDSEAPFTGTFKPEGEWKDLLGAPLEGDWQLGVIDNTVGTSGTITGWSLSFSGVAFEKFKYNWSTGETTKSIQVTEPGEYSVTVSNELASFSKTFVLYTPCNVIDSLSATIAPGETYNFGNQQLSQPGYYSQTFPAANGCDSIVVLHLLLSSGVNDMSAEWQLQVSPNPVTGQALLTWNENAGIARVRVYDLNGRVVLSQKTRGGNSLPLNTSGWSPGWYVVELEDGQGRLGRERLMVR